LISSSDLEITTSRTSTVLQELGTKMPPTNKSFVDHVIPYLVSNQPETESIPDEEWMDLSTSSAGAYHLSTILDNPMLPTKDGPSSPQSTSTGEPAWEISDDEFAELSSSSVTGYDFTSFLTDAEVPDPNPNPPSVLHESIEAFVPVAEQSFISWSPQIYHQYDNHAHRISTSLSPYYQTSTPRHLS
jgi:hypothetical protein